MLQRKPTQRKSTKESLKLKDGPLLDGHMIQHSDRYRLLVIDGALMHCTPSEYALLMRMLQQHERHLPFSLLEPCLCMRSPNGNPRSALIRHMRRLRPKLWPYGLDILSITGYGYMLHATPLEHAEQEPEWAMQPA
jgi:DNA-binding response OmpR family regulator